MCASSNSLQESIHGLSAKAIVDALEDPAFILDHEGKILCSNFCPTNRLSNNNRHPIYKDAKNILEALPYTIKNSIKHALNQTVSLKNNSAFTYSLANDLNLYEAKFSCINDNTVLLILYKTVLDNQGNAQHLKDVAQEHQRLNDIIEGAHVGTWEWNIRTGQFFINERFAELLGYSLSELTPFTADAWIKLAHEEDLLRCTEMLDKCFKNRIEHYDLAMRFKHRNDHWVWVHDRGKITQRDTNGKALFMLGTRMDITERKLSEEIRENLAKRLRLATSASGIGIWEWNIKTHTVTLDPQMCQQYELEDTQEIAFTRWKNTIHPEDQADFLAQINSTHPSSAELDITLRVATKHQQEKHVKIAGQMYYSQQGKPIKMVGTSWDISSLKHTEKALIEAKNGAEQAAKAKSEFLANMSHEIRTPMNGILGMLNLSLKSPLNEQQKTRLSLAHKSAKTLLVLINDILDFSKIEAGKLEIETIEFNIVALISEFTKSIYSLAQQKNLQLILDLSGITHPFVYGDPNRIRQILNNLVGNAIKFTETGSVKIICHTTQPANAHNHTQQHPIQFSCAVIDTGIGITEENKNTLFDAFSQADASTTRKYGGTGLGLSIVSHLCELMGGNIHVNSTLGKGSEFSFQVILSEGNTLRHNPIKHMEKFKHIGIISQNTLLSDAFYKQITAWQGDCTQLIDEHSDIGSIPFDLVFYDESLPQTSTAAILNTLEQQAKTTQTVYIHLAENDHSAGKSPTALNPRHKTFLMPLTPIDLCTIFNGQHSITQAPCGEITLKENTPALHEKNNTLKALSSLVAQSSKTANLLLVEDNRVNQEVIIGLFENSPIHIDIASNGIHCLEKLKNTEKNTQSASHYDLILMDCQMPELDGYETTRRIRLGEGCDSYKTVPIIAMTASAMIGDKEKCLACGMNDYLTKPIEESNTIQKIHHYLSIKETKESPTNTSPQKTDNQQIWDKDFFIKITRGKNKRMHLLLGIFLNDTPLQIHDIQQALASNDFVTINHLSHTIKGSSSNVGGKILHESALNLENASLQKNTESCTTLTQKVNEDFEELRKQLVAFLKITPTE